MLIQYIPYLVNVITISFLAVSVWFAFSAYKKKISWGKARAMGITASSFIWVQILFYLALFEGGIGVISFLVDLPFWIDILLSLMIIFIGVILYIKLLKRKTFKHKLFIAAIMVPLSIPGGAVVAKLIKTGTIETSRIFGIYIVKNQKNDATFIDNIIINNTKKDPHFPQKKETPIGKIEFRNSHEKGRLGDRITALRLTGMGYKKLTSKIDNIHGIDGVFIKKNESGEIIEVLIVENKVDSARLADNQMSNDWLLKQAELMRNSHDIALQKTGQIIIDSIDNPNIIFKKELWQHDLYKGLTIVKRLGQSGEVLNALHKYKDNLINNELKRACEKKIYTCELNKDINVH